LLSWIQSHRAGTDAFMTAFTYATMLLTHGPKQAKTWENLLPLIGKPRPLPLQASAYAKLSPTHALKRVFLFGPTLS
jgi:hypothetical protein